MTRGSVAYEKALREARGRNPDLSKVEKLLRSASQAGERRADYALGTWYWFGHHLAKDIQTAVAFFEAAAESRVPDALYNLAVCYEKGIGKPQDLRQAFEYYLRASLHGDEESVAEVGRCYYYGIGVKADRKVADIWLEKAEAAGARKANARLREKLPRRRQGAEPRRIVR